eukprot:PhM_4_TR8012/c0_g1_i1/m.45134/K15264/NSUN5, WBSCR20, RCM1; 25S rRNA (cytosine2278-C5)-methyltransferase
MDVYCQAAVILSKVLAGHGSATNLCLQKDVEKKKQTFAVVCEAGKNAEFLDAVIDQAELEKYSQETHDMSGLAVPCRDLLRVMLYDFLIGKGMPTSKGLASVLKQHATYIYQVADEVHKTIPTYAKGEKNEYDIVQEQEGKHGGGGATSGENELYGGDVCARINYLKEDWATLLEEGGALHGKVVRDELLPDLVWFPPGSKLHAHPLVKTSRIILQDYASCLPAHVLADYLHRCGCALPRKVIDACAAPGNKTTHVASLLSDLMVKNGDHDVATVRAIERDPERFKVLGARTHKASAGHKSVGRVTITCENADFFDVTDDDADVIVLDPTCSGGGERKASEQEYAAVSRQRVLRLAALQRRLLRHALTSVGPKVRVVVYSTCSTTPEEDEANVFGVAAEEDVKMKGWSVVRALPSWKERGSDDWKALAKSEKENIENGEEEEGERENTTPNTTTTPTSTSTIDDADSSLCVRSTRPPFFVALFARDGASLPLTKKERKQLKREREEGT